MTKKTKEFRKHIENAYKNQQFGFKGGFDEILCYELHTQPVNPRMDCMTINNGYETGLTFKELAQKWGITVSFLGELIKDHCQKLEV
ncbi:MAG: hypothetical protein NTU69_09965 [Proteobacteria bacterium]|nr:hypothetical protein [Pseudomonadota bacterium]